MSPASLAWSLASTSALTLALLGCAMPGTPVVSEPPAPTTSSDPPANLNLQGFPLPYRQGYADGCASLGSAERRDAARFQNDVQYRTGWQDGQALCRKR